MLQISLSETWEELISYGPAVWTGVFSAVITFIIEIRLCQKGILFSSGDKKIERAKRLGHVIGAKRVSCRYQDDPNDNRLSNRMYIANYEYQIDGKVKEKRIITTNVPSPSTITLYYLDSPAKVFSEYDVGNSRLQILLYIFPIIVAYIVMKLLGYTG